MVIKGGGGGGMLSSIGVLLSLAVRSKSACRCSNGSIWVTTSDKLPLFGGAGGFGLGTASSSSCSAFSRSKSLSITRVLSMLTSLRSCAASFRCFAASASAAASIVLRRSRSFAISS
jgi:uncharacterized membrane protein